METAIRFSPLSTPDRPRFLLVDVAQRVFNLGTLPSSSFSSLEKQREGLDVQLGPSVRQGVPAFRALDWAAGRTRSTFSSSTGDGDAGEGEGLVALGTPDGMACVLDLQRQDKSAVVAGFPARVARLCNAVAFGYHASSSLVLASGLEKAKGDFGLSIWDVNSHMSSGSAGKWTYVEPLRKFAPAEGITSIKFFNSLPSVLLAGVPGSGVRSFDLRDPSPNAAMHFNTPCSYNIAIDPMDERYFACAAGPTIQIWDCRYVTRQESRSDSVPGPTITYHDVFKPDSANIENDGKGPRTWSMRYCKSRPGLLGALASNGDFRVFETKHPYSSSETMSSESEVGSQLYTKQIHRIERPQGHDASRSRLVSFDFTNLAGSTGMPSLIFLRKDRTIHVHEMEPPVPRASLSATGSLVMGKLVSNLPSAEHVLEHEARLITPSPARPIADQHLELMRKLNGPDDRRGSSRDMNERLFGITKDCKPLTLEEALTLSTLSQRRCAEGYRFNCEKNIKIVSEDRWLQALWRWISRAKKHCDEGKLAAPGMNLNYAGIYDVWNQHSSNRHQSRKLQHRQVNHGQAVRAIVQKLDMSSSCVTAETKSPDFRRLCLYLIGYGLKENDIAAEAVKMASDGWPTKAAAYAVSHGHFDIAHEVLKRDGTQLYQILALAIAGFAKGSAHNMWNDTVAHLLKQLDDPYSRAIFALVKRGDWHDVVAEQSLPLQDRLGVALLHLSDDEVTRLIDSATSQAVEHGDIEGIALTGLSPSSIPLFQTYIRKFSGLQTAVLALSHTFPRFFSDPQVSLWQDTYRGHMTAWKMHLHRAQFDSALTLLSRTPDGVSKVKPSPRQLTLKCQFCDHALDRGHAARPSEQTNQRHPSGDFGIHEGSIFSSPGVPLDGNKSAGPASRRNSKPHSSALATASGTVCPSCGRHMPRCAVCLHWLGSPPPSGGAAAAAAKASRRRDNVDEKEDTSSEKATQRRVEIQAAMDNMTSICLACMHATHRGHVREWFAREDVCPVAGCECRCMNRA